MFVKRVQGSHALNSSWFPKGGFWQVGQSPGGSCGCPEPPLQTEEPNAPALLFNCPRLIGNPSSIHKPSSVGKLQIFRRPENSPAAE